MLIRDPGVEEKEEAGCAVSGMLIRDPGVVEKEEAGCAVSGMLIRDPGVDEKEAVSGRVRRCCCCDVGDCLNADLSTSTL